MSTAILPDAPTVPYGQSTEMDLIAVLARIDARLEAKGLNDHSASKLAGKPDAIRNMRRAVEAGRTGVNANTIRALAKVLEVSPAWLLGPEEGPPGDDPPPTGMEALLTDRATLLRKLEGIDYAISVLKRRKTKPLT